VDDAVVSQRPLAADKSPLLPIALLRKSVLVKCSYQKLVWLAVANFISATIINIVTCNFDPLKQSKIKQLMKM
jgi:hypothetical protein